MHGNYLLFDQKIVNKIDKRLIVAAYNLLRIENHWKMAQASLGENEEDFNAFESKVNQVMMILQMMNNSEPTLDKKGAGGVPKE